MRTDTNADLHIFYLFATSLPHQTVALQYPAHRWSIGGLWAVESFSSLFGRWED